MPRHTERAVLFPALVFWGIENYASTTGLASPTGISNWELTALFGISIAVAVGAANQRVRNKSIGEAVARYLSLSLTFPIGLCAIGILSHLANGKSIDSAYWIFIGCTISIIPFCAVGVALGLCERAFSNALWPPRSDA